MSDRSSDPASGPAPQPAPPEAHQPTSGTPASATARARRTTGRPVGGPRPSSAAPAPTSATRAVRQASGQRDRGTTLTDRGDQNPADDTNPSPAPALAPSGSRAGRNLPVAIGVGLGLGALVFATLFVYRPSFAVLVGVAVLYGSFELSRAFRSAGIRLSLVPIMLGGVAMLVAAWERGPSGLVVAVLITALAVLVWRVADGAEGYLRDCGASVFTVLYLPTLAGFAVLLVYPGDGAGRVLAFIATVVCSDTGGYATGVLFGRHPLAPVVSKAKTWEGFAGSVTACCVAGVLFMTLTFHEVWWKGLLFGAAIVVTATVGDLGESMIKRDLDIKDMGTVFPGHGGMMDRLDSLLPCAAVAYLLLSAFAPV